MAESRDFPPWEALPDGLPIAAGIDLSSPDPAYTGEPGKPRRCVAARKSGERCAATAAASALVCPIHAGRADPAAGGRAKAARRRHALEAAENRVAERALGVRAALAAQLAEQETEVRAIVAGLVTAGAAGDRKAAALLLPYLDQALGRPQERVEHTIPETPEELESLSTSQLEALVAQGRADQAAS